MFFACGVLSCESPEGGGPACGAPEIGGTNKNCEGAVDLHDVSICVTFGDADVEGRAPSRLLSPTCFGRPSICKGRKTQQE